MSPANGWTVQGLIDERMEIHAYSHNPQCHHNQPLDLGKLKAKLDRRRRNGGSSDSKLRYAKCSGNRVVLTYTPDTAPPIYRARS